LLGLREVEEITTLATGSESTERFAELGHFLEFVGEFLRDGTFFNLDFLDLLPRSFNFYRFSKVSLDDVSKKFDLSNTSESNDPTRLGILPREFEDMFGVAQQRTFEKTHRAAVSKCPHHRDVLTVVRVARMGPFQLFGES
jgi:hypothetical protein